MLKLKDKKEGFHSFSPGCPVRPSSVAMLLRRVEEHREASLFALTPESIELPFSDSGYTEFGLVYQAKIKFMILWGQIPG